MARLTNVEADKKRADGKSLFIKGLSVQSISEIIGISTSSINKWKIEGEWEEAKKINNISISQLRQEVLQTFNDLKNGDTPKLSADEITKLAAAFEKLNDKSKQLAYMYGAFEQLSEKCAQKVISASKKEKDFTLKSYQFVRKQMSELTEEIYNQTLND